MHSIVTLTNLCIALYFILLYCVVLNCIVLFIYCYVDIIQYNAMHEFVGVLDKYVSKLHSGTTYIHLHTYILLCFKVNSTIYNMPAGSKANISGSCLQELSIG